MHAVTYELIKECSRSGARLGKLHTPHGTFDLLLPDRAGPAGGRPLVLALGADCVA